jgi:DNA polymerase III subunit epsilon
VLPGADVVTRETRRLRALALGAGLAVLGLGAWVAMTLWLLGSALNLEEREAAEALLSPRLALLGLAVFIGVGAAMAVAHKLVERLVLPPARLREQAATLLDGQPGRRLDPQAMGGGADLQALAGVFNALAGQREALRTEIDARVAEGSRRVEQERSRLAALMAELQQAVVVCNLDGRILLYNQRARQQFMALSSAPQVAEGADLIGLGRSIHAVFDRQLVAHALERIRQQIERGVAVPSAQFVTTTAGGQLLRAQMAPVREAVLVAAEPATTADATGGVASAPSAHSLPMAPGAGGAASASGVAGTADEAPATTAATTATAPPVALSGFVLMLDNITHDYERASAQDALLHGLIEGSRAALGNLQAAAELLDAPTLDEATRERFVAVIREEARTLGRRLNEVAERSAIELQTRWPLEEVYGADLLAAAARRIEALPGVGAVAVEVEGTPWLRVDGFALLQALAGLAQRLAEEYGVRRFTLRLAAWAPQAEPGRPLADDANDSAAPAAGAAGAATTATSTAGQAMDSDVAASARGARPSGRARLDLVWPAMAISTETVMQWESEPLAPGGAQGSSVRDVVQRHAGAFWFERDRARQQVFFRWLLPLADEAPAPAGGAVDSRAANPMAALNRLLVRHDSRPESYDFDLFAASESQRALDDRPLAELSYTVFDCETTGLEPSAGDEIIQIGATRVLGGRLLRQESFEQLVDPQRRIPPAGIPIHGIRPEMVVGQPTIAQVLPAFHAYARDTVLVAHNAAFDLRFLQLAEARSGVVFDQPVLDTLLLSALVHPNQDSHRLEAIAERFGIPVVGRHTALGDALVTAEVLVRLLPLLAAMDIHTLGQARQAAQATYYARIQY